MSMTADPASSSSTSSSTDRRAVPKWAIGLVILLIVVVVGGLVWSMLSGFASSGSATSVSIDEKPSEYQGAARAERSAFYQRKRQEEQAARREAEMKGPDFVHARPGGNALDVKGGTIRLVASRLTGGTVQLRVEPMDLAIISDDDRQTLTMRNRILGEDAVARQLEVTPDQKTALKAIPGQINYAIDGPTRKNFETLVGAWEKAPQDGKKPAEDALIAAVKDFESKNTPGFKASLEDRVAKVKAILKPDQVAKFNSMGK